MANKELLETIRKEIINRIDKRHLSEQAKNELVSILAKLSDLEKAEEPKRVRTLEKEFDGYNPIVVTLDKYVLGGIGIGRNDKAIIKIQRKED